MSFTRVRVSLDSSNKLKVLKARTGLTPNVLCRIAFTASLKEPGLPAISPAGEEPGLEFNRYTLTGEFDVLFIALLKERLTSDGLNPELDLIPHFKAHLDRGISIVYVRIKSLLDLPLLM